MMIRDDFPFLDGCIYMNSASCSPSPEPVLDAMLSFYRHNPINYRSGTTPAEARVTEQIDGVRARLARFINARSPEELVFTKNTTEALNMVAAGLDWQPGDEVVVSPLEHQSNLVPWQRLAHEAGVVVRFVVPGADGSIDPDDVRSLLGPRTKLVALHHVSNVLGVEQDIRAVAEIAHEHDVLVLADAAQSEGRIDVDVQALDCDFLASCARKALMGPQGVGFLYARGDGLRDLRPLTLGSQAATSTGETSFELAGVPERHEAGILNTAGLVGLGAALEYVEGIGRDAVADSVADLTARLRAVLADVGDVDVYGPEDSELGIVSWNVRGRDAGEVAAQLYERSRIMVSAGSCGSPLALKFLGVPALIRTSLHAFNSVEDVDGLGEALHTVVRGALR
jgi:cysteine desulfurase/selenocysteine lyase